MFYTITSIVVNKSLQTPPFSFQRLGSHTATPSPPCRAGPAAHEDLKATTPAPQLSTCPVPQDRKLEPELRRLPPWIKYIHTCLEQDSGSRAPVLWPPGQRTTSLPALFFFLVKWKYQCKPFLPQMESFL